MKVTHGRDPDKWLITKAGDGCWVVYTPVRSFWGLNTWHDTFDEAVADFRRQTSHIRERAWIQGLDR